MKEYIEIEVRDDSGEVTKTYKVKRVKRSKLNDLIELQKDLLYSFIKFNAAVGVLISDNSVWHTMETVAKMLPVVGQDKPGLPLSEIEDNYDLLRSLFFTQCAVVNGVIDTENGFLSSLIADLHQLDYHGEWGKQLDRVTEELKEKAKQELSQEPQLPEEQKETTESES